MAAPLCSRELEEILSACFIEESVIMAATLCSREFGEAHEKAGPISEPLRLFTGAMCTGLSYTG